jgi:hypothetical protein
MSIIVTGGQIQGARIGYKNIFENAGATVTVSTETAGFEKENAYDWKQYDWWKPTGTSAEWIASSFGTAQTADYAAVWGHNLNEVAGSVKPQYSTDGGSTWIDASTAVSVTTGRTIFIGFDSTTAADWRLLFASTGTVIIAGVQIGEATIFDKSMSPGFMPSALSPEIESKTAMSELGINLGVSTLRSGVSGTIQLSNLSPTWVRSDWVSLIAHLNGGKSCVFTWDYEQHNDEAVLIWKKGQISTPSYITPLLMSAALTFEGIL